VVPARFLRTWFDYQPNAARTRTRCPSCSPTRRGPLDPNRAIQRFYDKLTGPKQLVILENCGHFPLEEPGLAQLETALQEFAEQVGA